MSGRRTAFRLVNDARQVAERFTVGDRVSICYTSDSFPGVVTKVEAEIGKVWVDFAGNVKQMDPFEIRHDVADVVPIKDSEAYTVSPVKAPEASVEKKREAIYHFQKGRSYKLTRKEQNDGTAFCPRCRAEMTRSPFARGIQLYECPDCEFRITTDHVFDAEYRAPEQNDAELPIVEEADEPMDVMIAKRISVDKNKTAYYSEEAYNLVQKLSNTQQEKIQFVNNCGFKVQRLEELEAQIEGKIIEVVKSGGAQAVVDALKEQEVDTDSMNSRLIDLIEKSTGVTIYPTPWKVQKPSWALVTASRKTVLAAAGPLTLLQQLESDLKKGLLENDDHLRMIGNGWGHTPGVDYIFGAAAEDIVWNILGFAAGHKEADKVRQTIKKNIDEALKDNQPFEGLRGEQKETRELWHSLMEQRRNGLRG